MKIKNFLLIVLLCVIAANCYAKQISKNEAQSIALNYLQENSNRLLQGLNSSTPQLNLAMVAKSKSMDEVDYYVFNMNKDKGYIIISGDDRAASILGYSDEGAFDINNVPDGLQYWLEMYSEEMQYLRNNPNALKASKRSQHLNSVRPLLTCNWNQGVPYNNMCPTFNKDGETYRSVTGCVATAAAQIMYYHRWPITGTGSHSYVCNVNKTEEQTLSADFSSTTYDWDNMLDNYSGSYNSSQVDAIATFMYHVGVACDMGYGQTSGAYVYDMMEAMKNYFNYSKGMRDIKRGNTPITEWEQIIINELNNSRPVLYAGYTPTGGHAFVFDGYNTDGYFHVNWGWGGSSNGYFLVTALNPSDQGIGSFEGGYNSGQEIVVGICRDDSAIEPSNYVELVCEEFKANVSQVNLGDSVPISLNRFSINGYGFFPEVAVKYGFNLTDLNNNSVDFNDNSCYYYLFKFGACYTCEDNYYPSTSITDGQYRLWLMYMVPEAGMTEYVPYNHPNTTPGYINVRVENEIMYFDEPTSNDGILSLESLEVPEKVGTNSQFEVKATIHNAGDEYYDNIYFVVMQNGSDVITSDVIKIDVANGDDVIVKSYVTSPDNAGTYQIEVRDKKNQPIGQPVTLNVAESNNHSLYIESQIVTPSYYMNAYDINASAVIGNSGTGDFIGIIQMMIINEEITRVLKVVNSPTVIIPAGQSITVNFQCEFGGNEGILYNLCLRNFYYPYNYYIWGNLVTFEIQNNIPGDVNGDGACTSSDVTALYNHILYNDSSAIVNGDQNGDGSITSSDVTAVYNIILGI